MKLNQGQDEGQPKSIITYSKYMTLAFEPVVAKT
jgi:hypothetical protein